MKTKTAYNVPARRFSHGPKRMTSWRVPAVLLKELDRIAKKKGYTVTELVMTVLDQYVQSEK